jgi:pilus assembly protein Flp/PilA
MSEKQSLMQRFVSEEEGGTAVEYGLIVAVIAVALIAGLVAFSGEISSMFNRAGSDIKSAT